MTKCKYSITNKMSPEIVKCSTVRFSGNIFPPSSCSLHDRVNVLLTPYLETQACRGKALRQHGLGTQRLFSEFSALRRLTMAANGAAAAAPAMTEQAGPHWYEQQKSQDPNARSVTPAMNNTRGVVRNGTAPYSAASPVASQYSNAARSTTPQQRYYGAYNAPAEETEAPQPPPSTGLIRLTLRKPMGIVFEPMYDPNNPTVQRGVRICDLPRTGAAALSRKLEIGDELLSINDKTMSRLTFDEIMDFIIEADPDQVNLLFRRPRKGLPIRAPKNITTPQNASVKWPDDDQRKSKKDSKKKSTDKEKDEKREKKPSKRSKRDEDSTIVSQEESLEPLPRRKYRSRDMYENESFLDMLIDTICGKPDGYCGDRPRRGDDDYYSDEEDTFASMDDSTYVTYESEQPPKSRRKPKGRRREDDSTAADETEDDTYASPEEDAGRKSRHKKKADRTSKSPTKESRHQEKAVSPKRAGRYEEDEETFEETVEETVEPPPAAATASPPPLGLEPAAADQVTKEINTPAPETAVSETEDEANPAPIAELEYDEDNGADVSVMESLGGPSLLIEKQRQAAKVAAATADGPVPAEIINNFGGDFPADFGLSREQTIQKNPMKFYTHVVKDLLEEHEPEKVRLLDKLLAKYKGREDHLVQKLAVRYTKAEEQTPTIPEETEGNGFNFTEVVNQTKESAATEDRVNTAKERMASASPNFETVKWPNKGVNVETEVLEEGEEVSMGSESVSGSDEFSGDSIDGTSPAVIAQVSELLNYVYGKTSVPGQIDRVSTIMRAYEGREAVLLELLETKALIKANGEKENAADLPSFLRNSPALQHAVGDGQEGPSVDENKPVSPLSGPSNAGVVSGLVINDDISSMSGVSSPADDAEGNKVNFVPL